MTPSPRTKLRRKPGRGSHDRALIESILDEALVCHLGVVDPEGVPVVTPTLHARVGSDVYVHGSAASRTLRTARDSQVCLTATLVEKLVPGRWADARQPTEKELRATSAPSPIHSWRLASSAPATSTS